MADLKPLIWGARVKTELTKRQSDVYDFIRDKIQTRGYGPTVREISAAFGIRSPNGVICHLKALEKKGLITRKPNQSRAIELTRDRETSLMMIQGRVERNGIRLDATPKPLNLARAFQKRDNFLLRVARTDLGSENICLDDLLVVGRQSDGLIKPGSLVVLESDGQSDLARVTEFGNTMQVERFGRSEPEEIAPNRVSGIVVGLIRGI